MFGGCSCEDWTLTKDGILNHPNFLVRFLGRLFLWSIGIGLLFGFIWITDHTLDFINWLLGGKLPWVISSSILIFIGYKSLKKEKDQ